MERRQYSAQELREGAEAVGCMSELLRLLAVEPTPGRRSYLRKRLARSGVDLSHWRHSPRSTYTRDQLAEAVRRRRASPACSVT